MLYSFTFNPNGVIHIYQYFEKYKEPTHTDLIIFLPSIQSVQYKGARTEIVVKNTFIQHGHEVGYTISCFGVQGHVVIECCNSSSISLDFKTNVSRNIKRVILPNNGDAYADVSLDYNPIHRNDQFAINSVFAFDAKIMHGMWTVSCILSIKHDVRRGFFRFESPLYYYNPKNQYITIDNDSVMDTNNRSLIKFALDISCEIGVCFAGQGSLSVKQGLKLYDKHIGTRTIYNVCNETIRRTFGLDIINILKHNPKEIYVYVNDSNRKYWKTDKSHVVISHNDGIINFSPVTQVLTILYEYCVYKQSGIKGTLFCGHSLGEYIVPLLLLNIPIERVITLVFLRGLSMIDVSNLHCDTEYRMIAINPSRIGKTFSELTTSVTTTAEFVEIVNYNIKDRQYVVAGTKQGLNDMLRTFENNQTIDISNSKSGILLKGINVPFHSSYLKPKSVAFRECLFSVFDMTYDYTILVGSYVPNLTGKVFYISRQYLSLMQSLDFENAQLSRLDLNWDTYSDNQRAYIMFIELLTLQFCSPVNWIDTVEYMSCNMDIIYEISPKPILLRMIDNQRGIDMVYINEDS
jgi:fatty acid synthase